MKLENSLQNGPHYQLGQMTGEWEGSTKTWFEPDQLADESPMTGSIKSILGGRFLLHEYKGSLQGKPFEGLAIYGYDLSFGKYQCAWIDSFHMSTAILFSEKASEANAFDVLGSYRVPEVPEAWGWRTELQLSDSGALVITAYNITPDGVEAKATETTYHRVG